MARAGKCARLPSSPCASLCHSLPRQVPGLLDHCRGRARQGGARKPCPGRDSLCSRRIDPSRLWSATRNFRLPLPHLPPRKEGTLAAGCGSVTGHLVSKSPPGSFPDTCKKSQERAHHHPKVIPSACKQHLVGWPRHWQVWTSIVQAAHLCCPAHGCLPNDDSQSSLAGVGVGAEGSQP